MPDYRHENPLTPRDQVALLRSRGMVFQDEAAAERYLGFISYHRLAAYWQPFEAGRDTPAFLPGTSFDRVLDLYAFDRGLRLLLIDAIERVEVAVRTRFAYELTLAHGPRVLLSKALFNVAAPRWSYADSLRRLQTALPGSREAIVRDSRQRSVQYLPPVWVVVEWMTLGELSKWYSNLKHRADRNRIARTFDFDESRFVSFLHHLAFVRNLCAHHSRVWNRRFTFALSLPRQRPEALQGNLNPDAPGLIYNTLTMLAFCMDTVSPGHRWTARMRALLEDHSVRTEDMGFPSDWRKRRIWQ